MTFAVLEKGKTMSRNEEFTEALNKLNETEFDDRSWTVAMLMQIAKSLAVIADEIAEIKDERE